MSYRIKHQILIKYQIQILITKYTFPSLPVYILGWAGGSIKDENVFDTLDLMMNQSLSTSIIAAKLAALYLGKNGLLVLTGAGMCYSFTDHTHHSFCFI